METLVSFLFRYPTRVWERGEIVWSPVIPVWGIILLGAIAVVGIGVVQARIRGVGRWTRVALFGIRALTLLILVAALLRPTLVVASAVPQRNILAIVLDDSRSMRIADVDGATRAEAVAEVFGDSAELVRELGERFALRFYRFAADIYPASAASGLSASGTRTDMATALHGLRDELSGAPLAGVVMVTDGADNSGSDIDAALLGMRARRVPVHTVGVGMERFQRDVAIERVALPSRPLKGAHLLADVTLSLRGVGGERLVLTAEANGRIVATDTVTLPQRETTLRTRLRLPELEPGTHAIAVRAAPLPRETVLDNNEGYAVVHVRQGPDRILYVEGEPRSELAFLRRGVATDSALQLVTLLRSAERKYLRLGVRDSLELAGGFPASREELFSYRGLILGSIEASFFTPDQLRMIGEFVSQRGGGLLALGGRSSFAEGGYRGTPVAEVLPIAFDRAPLETEVAAAEWKLKPTQAGLEQGALQLELTGERTTQKWDSLPPLTVVNALGSLRPGATAWLTGRTEGGNVDYPILAMQRFGRGTATLFGVQDSWLWRMHADVAADDRTHETFWRQLARALTEEAPERVEVTSIPERVAPGEPVTLRARVTDERYVDVNDASVTAVATMPSGRVSEVSLDWSLAEDGVYTGKFLAEEEGVYSITAVARRGRDTTFSPSAALVADDKGADVEQAELRAPLLRRIAAQTGGKYYPIADAQRLADDVQYTESGVTVRETYDLWDLPAVFLTIALLLASEWAIRRSRGLG